jgi:D-glycerate 3-kinase
MAADRFPYSPGERKSCLDPLASRIRRARKNGATVVIGLQGGQGTGKTTLSRYLEALFTGEGLRVATFSLDDFYRSLDERRQLAAEFPGNPFYALPRGMPGTHRTSLLDDHLVRLKRGEAVDLPVFDKGAHDGAGEIASRAVPVRGRQDLVLFEGWCLGMPRITAPELLEICRRAPLPRLPRATPEDYQAVLAHLPPYLPIWKRIDLFVMLRADSDRLHERWRLDQEKELIARTGSGLRDAEVRALVRHYLPFTRLCYEKIVPDVLLRIDSEHRYRAILFPGQDAGPPP